ncbi:MAG: DNA translocase FtsK [Bdellovibrionales bacterium]
MSLFSNSHTYLLNLSFLTFPEAGHRRATRMIEIFESEGVVGPANESKPRRVY